MIVPTAPSVSAERHDRAAVQRISDGAELLPHCERGDDAFRRRLGQVDAEQIGQQPFHSRLNIGAFIARFSGKDHLRAPSPQREACQADESGEHAEPLQRFDRDHCSHGDARRENGANGRTSTCMMLSIAT
jgi:hypothetical protein